MKGEKEKIRVFIAVPVPEEIKNNIANSQEILKQKFDNDKIKWVKANLMHITIKFLGDIETAMIPDMKKMVQKSIADANSFKLSVKKIGVFPGIRKPRIIWAGIEQDVGKLVDIHEKINENINVLGFKKESKGLTPHITLARVKHKPINSKILKQVIEESQRLFLGEFQVNNIILYKSELYPTGPLYTPLWSVDFFFLFGTCPKKLVKKVLHYNILLLYSYSWKL